MKRPALFGGIFKQHDPFVSGFAQPGQLVPPIGNMRDHPGQGVTTQWLRDVNLDLVALGEEMQIKRAKVAIISNP